MSLVRAFEKMSSICANYTKGLGKVFHQWMLDNHSGELLLHVEIAESGGRKDFAFMA